MVPENTSEDYAAAEKASAPITQYPNRQTLGNQVNTDRAKIKWVFRRFEHNTNDTKRTTTMNSMPSNDQKMASDRQMRDTLSDQEILDLPTVLVATIDPHIQQSIGELLKAYPIKVVWAKCVEELRSALTRENVSVCLCGFWLVDGTYRDVVRHVKRQPMATPVVMVCASACPNEYRDYLAGLNILAFDFICYPYQASRVGEILQSAIEAHHESLRLITDPPQGSARAVVGFSHTGNLTRFWRRGNPASK